MKPILKVCIVGGLVLAVFYYLLKMNHLPSFPIHIIVIPGGMMYAINGYLKPVENRRHYTYMMGVGIGFFYGILALTIGITLFNLVSMTSFEAWTFGGYFESLVTVLTSSFLLIFISAFLVPTIYLGQQKSPQKNQTDILDDDL